MFPDVCVVNGKLIEAVPDDQLLDVAQSVGEELKRRSLDSHRDSSSALSMRTSGTDLVHSVERIRVQGSTTWPRRSEA